MPAAPQELMHIVEAFHGSYADRQGNVYPLNYEVVPRLQKFLIVPQAIISRFSNIFARLETVQQNSRRLIKLTVLLAYPTSTEPMADDNEFHVWPELAAATGSGGDELFVEQGECGQWV